ncbi:MAG TPA: ABC transporter permease [Candidatus Polarisedimenticolaceae bacterium]|nr:ABC transporter permease [Candidatus Polarisedimenticolaceae bacterium]
MTLHEAIVDGLVDVRTHKLRTLLQTLGVILGVASLVAVQGLADAGRRQSMKFFAEFGGLTKLFVGNRPPKETTLSARQLASVGLTWDDVRAIREEVAHAKLVDPVVQLELPVRYGDYRRTREISGVTPDYPAVYQFRPARGRFVTEDDLAAGARVVVLGDTAARSYFGNLDPLGKTLFIGEQGFTVVGVMRRKEFFFREEDRNALEWMNRMTFVPLTTIYARFTGDARKPVNYLNVMVDKVDNNETAASELRALLSRRHGGLQDFEVHNRAERLRQRAEQNRTFDVTFLVTGIVSLIVGGIVIMNIMLASFQERIREVGVRKALGARSSDIAVQFLVESLLVTAIGGAVGLAVGVGFAKGITALIGLPTIITPRMALVGVIASVSTGLVFGLYPAVRAARLNPVEALRYE